ncbi:hypothetical protein FOZ63_011896, partial [Perkinsus olseni]
PCPTGLNGPWWIAVMSPKMSIPSSLRCPRVSVAKTCFMGKASFMYRARSSWMMVLHRACEIILLPEFSRITKLRLSSRTTQCTAS